MTGYLKYIAVIDKEDKVHFVKFSQGVNVITGKSSTGKSAMIEIFDYCFGNTNYTVPDGVITESAELYFIVLFVESTHIVLARYPNSKKAFLKQETNLPDIDQINREYFKEDFFLTLEDFKVDLGRCFGIDIFDTDVDLEDRKYRKNNAKSPRPTVRNFTSFMLQHQNLVANKHSIFYRFDEKEKRDQTIDNFKIFTGFVTQKYYVKRQKINELESELKDLQNKQNQIEKQKQENTVSLSYLFKEYEAITGKLFLNETAENVLRNPANCLENIKRFNIIADNNSDKHVLLRNELNEKENMLIAERKKLQIKHSDINDSIKYAEQYKADTESTSTLTETTVHLSHCPFCKSKNENLALEANLLEDAINWLNSELIKTPYMLDSFLSEEKQLKIQLSEIDTKSLEIKGQINKLDNIVIELENNKSLKEQGLMIKLKVENLLEGCINNNLLDFADKISAKENEIKKLEKEIRDEFNLEQKLRNAEKFINEEMKKIGGGFDFEKSYKPINLKFSLDSFDLWHDKPNKNKVFLRSMGSGANWLYCHLTLFTSLHKYFCSLGNQCLIHSILFLDQPSQVYFPISIDYEEDFNARELKKKEGKEKRADEDLRAVTDFYNNLVNYCSNTLKETGIQPQIIITDHADNLKLENIDNIEFETLVNGRRWRKRGFIEQ